MSAPAQSKRHRWNWKLHKLETINYVKTYLVSSIEPELPRRSFETWFRKVVRRGAKVHWAVVHCSERGIDPSTTSRDEMCVEVKAFVGSDIVVGVVLKAGSFRNGISRKKPVSRFIWIDCEGEEATYVNSLTALPKTLNKMLGW